MSRKDKQQKQQQRLNEGRCPVHGVPMTQISRSFDDRDYTYGGCPRRDCDLAAKFREPFGAGFDLCERKQAIQSERIAEVRRYRAERDIADESN